MTSFLILLCGLWGLDDRSVLEASVTTPSIPSIEVHQISEPQNDEILLAFKTTIRQWIESERAKPLLRRDLHKIRVLTRALRDDALMEYLANRYSAEISEAVSASDGGGRFLEIIQWIIENQDEIIRFIMAIIGLFGDSQALPVDHYVIRQSNS